MQHPLVPLVEAAELMSVRIGRLRTAALDAPRLGKPPRSFRPPATSGENAGASGPRSPFLVGARELDSVYLLGADLLGQTAIGSVANGALWCLNPVHPGTVCAWVRRLGAT